MLTSIMLGMTLTMAAQHELRDLDIQVELADNGDATITETRQMTIGDEGTECYIVIGNLNNSRITSLQVSDETGTTYVTEDGDWDVDRSRSEKPTVVASTPPATATSCAGVLAQAENTSTK